MSERYDHYIALFGCYDHKDNVKSPLLALKRLPDYGVPNKTTAATQKEVIISTLEFYQREPEELIFFVGDNCSASKYLAGFHSLVV